MLDEAVGGADGDAEVTVDANGELDDRALQNNTKKSLMKKLRQQVVPEANENGSSKFASGVPAFLQKVYGKEQTNKVQVTLTFAQTVNGKIGNPRGQPQLAVSGSESMEMTHWLVDSLPLVSRDRSLIRHLAAGCGPCTMVLWSGLAPS